LGRVSIRFNEDGVSYIGESSWLLLYLN
jgi:hypothetical protein